MLSLKEIRKACSLIYKYINETPLAPSFSLSKITGAQVFLKAENLQKTGSFKVRGAFNKLHGLKGKVITASMGNHAQAVAYAATTLGIKAKIVMPEGVTLVKAEATKNYGAEVEFFGETYREALEYALSQKNYTFVHGFDDEKIIAGQGTIGVEILKCLPDPDIIIVPVGGGGLISGVALAVKELSPKIKVIGVQTKNSPAGHASFKKGKIVEITPLRTIADGIAISRLGDLNFEIIKKYVDDIILVSEESIAMSILLFMERKKLVVEGAGATSLACLLEHGERFKGKKVVLILSGGNIDFNLIDRIIYKGLRESNRIGIFETIVEDVPGSLRELSGIIAGRRGNILHVQHDRLSRKLPVGKTKIIFTVEIRDKEHLTSILRDMRKRGFNARVID